PRWWGSSYTSIEYQPSLWWTFGFTGHPDQVARFLRSLAFLGISAVAFLLYAGLRVPAPFHPPTRDEIERALKIHEECGTGTSPLMVAAGAKPIFFFRERAFAAYRVVGSYVLVLSDPTALQGEHRDFLGALTARAREPARR